MAISIMMLSCSGNRNNLNPITPNLGTTTVTTFAGPSFQITNPATVATFNAPTGVAVDTAGNVYVADQGNNLIRKIDPSGTVTTLAGSGQAGSANGTGTNASFNQPWGVAVDATGNVYVADKYNNMIRKISPAGVVTTLAGSGTAGSANGTGPAATFYSPSGVAVDTAGNVYVADDGNNLIRKINSSGLVSTLASSFSFPSGVAIDAAGNVYVSDQGSQSIRKISPAGVVSTLAGSGAPGSANGTGAAASFNQPIGVAVDAAGNVYVGDEGNNLIREISPSAVVSTLAGGGAGFATNGAGTVASFAHPFGVAVDAAGNVYVADFSSNMIRKINSSDIVSTLAGTGTAGSANTTTATTTTASFNQPSGVAVDATGNVYVADVLNNMIRKISPAGVVSTLAGSGTLGLANGTGAAASFYRPAGVTVDATGNVYVADEYNSMIRKISSSGVVTTLAGSGSLGSTNTIPGPVAFNFPTGVAVDVIGIVLVADQGNNLIRQVGPSGITTTFAGSGASGAMNGIIAVASFKVPIGVAVDPAGNVYVADAGNNMIRMINSAAVVSTLAGSGAKGSNNGTGTAASFNQPWGVAVDATGNVYVADAGNNQIRKISPLGVVTILAGSSTGAAGSANGPGYAATFNYPTGVAVDAAGNIYVADQGNSMIRKITQ